MVPSSIWVGPNGLVGGLVINICVQNEMRASFLCCVLCACLSPSVGKNQTAQHKAPSITVGIKTSHSGHFFCSFVFVLIGMGGRVSTQRI